MVSSHRLPRSEKCVCLSPAPAQVSSTPLKPSREKAKGPWGPTAQSGPLSLCRTSPWPTRRRRLKRYWEGQPCGWLAPWTIPDSSYSRAFGCHHTPACVAGPARGSACSQWQSAALGSGVWEVGRVGTGMLRRGGRLQSGLSSETDGPAGDWGP